MSSLLTSSSFSLSTTPATCYRSSGTRGGARWRPLWSARWAWLAMFVLLLAGPGLRAADVRISEFMASNVNMLKDEDGEYSDWIELYNASGDAVNLDGWYLTDVATNLTQWRFPDVVMPANSYLIVFASQKNKTNVLGRLHTNFRLSSSGEYLALVDKATNVVSEFAPVFPAQQSNVSYGRDQAEPTAVGFFFSPTPGTANSTSGTGFGPPVKFSRPSGHFQETFDLVLSVPAGYPDAVIRYTLDGSLPSSTAARYTNALTLTNTTRVRARAFQAGQGLLPGPFHSEVYVKLATDVMNFSSDLPIAIVHTFGLGVTDLAVYQPAYLEIIEPTGGRTYVTNPPAVTTRIGLQNHGSSTGGQPKHNLRVELWDELNSDRKMTLLDLPEESDYIFYAPNNFEPIEIHNPFAYGLSRQMGRYAPRTRYVEVFLAVGNGPISSAEYNGLYVLEENVKLSKNRVTQPSLSSTDLLPPDVTGGFLMKFDRVNPGDSPFDGGGLGFQVVDPSGLELRSSQRRPQLVYLTNFIHDFETALNGPNFADPVRGYAPYVDIPAALDYHILNLLTFNVDAFVLSAYFYKEREGKIVFGPQWDFDRALNSTDGRDINPRVWGLFGRAWYARLLQDVNLWQKWIDRYNELRQNEFSLTNLFTKIDENVAIIKEAVQRDHVRWSGWINPRGGFSNEVVSLKLWLSNRVDFFDHEFQAPPKFSHLGGPIQPGLGLDLAVDGPGTIYYTMDGSDPRGFGGVVATNAIAYTGQIVITNNARVVARVLNPAHKNQTGAPNPEVSTPWSAPTAATFIVRTPPLVVTEIMYHPEKPAAGSTNSSEDFEYVELRNIGLDPLALRGFRLSGGIDFDFTTSSVPVLAPGQRVLVVRNLQAFAARYPAAGPVAGAYEGTLNNGGDHLRLQGPVLEPILDFDYSNNWYPMTDGYGFSLTIVDDHASLSSWGLADSWRVSGEAGGSPGVEGAPALTLPVVLVNEVLTHTPPGTLDAVEFFNPGATAVDISGWFLTDDSGTPRKYRLPTGSVIPGGGFLVLDERNFNAPANAPLDFSFSSKGEEVYLFSGNSRGELSGYRHGFKFGAADLGVSFGRYVDSTGREQFVAQSTNSLNGTNALPKVGPVVISEIMYHPPDTFFQGVPQDNPLEEFIELENLTAEAVPLFDPAFPTNTWRIAGGVGFSFPTNQMLPPQGHALVVNFDPSEPELAAAFRTRYGLDASMPLYGPLSGRLSNSGEHVVLQKPRAPEPLTAADAGFVAYVEVDRVEYTDSVPWAIAADGIGPSLQRINSQSFGNDPANWAAAAPSANRVFVGGQPPGIAVNPRDVTLVAYQETSFSVVPVGQGPFSYQWRLNGTNLRDATNATLVLTNVQPTQAGEYVAVVLNPAGTVASFAARLVVLMPATILIQPKSQDIRLGGNVTFGVSAVSTTQMRYQWRHYSVDLPGATNATLTLTNLTVPDQGFYSVLITDGIGPVLSIPALLNVLIAPTITQQPQSVTAVQGENVSFSVSTAGHPLPMSFRWRRNGGTLPAYNYIVDKFTTTITLTNVQAANAGNYSVVVTNLGSAGTVGVLSSTAVLTVLADADGDHLPDIYETPERGLNPQNPADAHLDFDGDGFDNLQEYIAGTDPNDASSHLRVLQLSKGAGPAGLSFLAMSNRNYTVQFKESAESGVWTRLADVLARPTNRVETVNDPYPPSAQRVYRLVAPVQAPPQPGPVLLSSPRSQTVYSGADVTMDVTAFVTNAPLGYQWFFNSIKIPGATNAALAMPDVRTNLIGNYTVAVTGALGVVTSQIAKLVVLDPPVINVQPADQIANPGASVTFTVQATGFDPLTYRWYFNGNLLRGETSASLTLNQLSAQQAGEYSVLVRHETPFGPAWVKSRLATLIVQPPEAGGN